jgi:hypothetical protein
MGVLRDLPDSGLGICLPPPWGGEIKSKSTDGLLQKNGQNHCKPSLPDKHPHARYITRTHNDVKTKLGAEGVWMLRATCELPVNGNDLHPKP